MSVSYGSAQQIPPGIWAKAGRDSDGNWHILVSENPNNIQDSSSTGHDHYYQKNGSWYVQIRTQPGSVPVSDARGHVLEPNMQFSTVPSEYLDNLFRQLVES